MLTDLKSLTALAVSVCIGIGSMSAGASAVTADIAKKCEALTARAFPPRVPGNPAARGARGTGPAEKSYYSNCVANGGNIPGSPAAPQGIGENTGTDSVPPPLAWVDETPYRPCPASVFMHGRNFCLGTPGRGYSVGPRSRHAERRR
jgi:hypothetical protein